MQSNHRFIVLTKAEDGTPIAIDRRSNVCFSPEAGNTRVWPDGRMTGFLVTESTEAIMQELAYTGPWAVAK